MRTTLTLDDDVAAMIETLRKRQRAGLKRLINDALRQGLAHLDSPGPPPAPYRTPSRSVGRCLLPSRDNIAEVLAVTEGEGYR